MRGMRVLGMAAIVSALVVTAACGKRFPIGERFPITYGPPFGSALKDNLPHKAKAPVADERGAETLAKYRSFENHGQCNAHMAQLLAASGGEHHGPVQLSPSESVGHYTSGGVTTEYRCSRYTLTRRGWCDSRSPDFARCQEEHGEHH
jgi:hypothetical protein